ncbi:MAG TPA: hypothetical protein PL188_02860 [Candidatus Cloacimonadota bacterium]|nr:hypothetical protein [Candidatus Cloacimonadota bacterium]
MKIFRYLILTAIILSLCAISWAQARNSQITQPSANISTSGKTFAQIPQNPYRTQQSQYRDVVYSTDFAGAMPVGWTANIITGPANWAWTNTGGNYGGQLLSTTAANGYMIFDSDGLGAASGEEADLISPAIDCTGATGDIFFSVEHWARTFGAADIAIYISTDDFVSQTELYRWFGAAMNDANGTNPVTTLVNINAYAAGQSNVKIKFKWIGAYDYWWLVDDFSIFTATAYQLTMLDPIGTGNVFPAVGSHTYTADTIVNLTAEPGFGYTFGSWNEGDVADATKARTTILMDESQDVQATFTEYTEDLLYRQQGYGSNGVTSVYVPDYEGAPLDYEVADNFNYAGIDEIQKFVVYGTMQTYDADLWTPWTPSATEPFIVRFYDENSATEPDWANPVSTQNLIGKVFRAGTTGSWTIYKVEFDLTTPVELTSGWVSAQIDVNAGAGGWFLFLTATTGGDGVGYQKGNDPTLTAYDVMFELWGTTAAILPPTGMTATDITITSASLGWTEAGSATEWDIEWGGTGFAQGTGTLITATTQNPYPLSGLSGSTPYQWYVRSNYGGGVYSSWAGPHGFTTAMAPIPIDTQTYNQNFDSVAAPAIPQGWTIVNANSDAYAWVTSTSYPRSAPNSMYIRWNTSLATNDYAISPPLALTAGNTYVVDFWYRTSGSYYEKLKIMLGSAPTPAALTTTVVDLGEIINSAYLQSTTTFTVPSTGTYYLGWHGYSDANMWYLCFDDVSIRPLSDAKDILTYSVPGQLGGTVIDPVNHTVNVEVGYSAPRDNLIANFTLSTAAKAYIDDGITRVLVQQFSGVTANDFTNPVTYVIEAENGTTQEWVVTVSNSLTPSSDKEILAFSFAQQTGPAVIDRDAFTVDIEVKYQTDVTNLVPTFTLSDWATAWVNDEQQSSGVTANDYSERVDYVIRAEDDSEQVWRVNVSVHAPILVSMPFSEDFEGASIGLNIVNGAQPNFWTVGTATFNGGAKSAYISNDVVTFPYAYTNNVASVVHMYVDLDFPADCSQYDLNFNWKAQGESGWDFLKVYLTDIYTTPVAGTQMLVGNQIGNVQYNMGGADTWNLSNIVLPGTLSGQARRLVFSWRNDTSGGEQPPVALDDISLTFTLAGQDDLAATAIDGSFQGMVNTQVLFDVTVQNVGLVAQTEYTVELRSVDDRALLASLEVDQLLPVGEEETWTIAWTPDTIGTYNVYGQVVLTGDEDLDNDATDPMAFEVYAPIALPFVETWDAPNSGWAAGSTNWGLASTGNPAPAIQFSWSPTVTDYSIGLYSREIDATAATFVRFKYDYYLSNYSTSTLEGMRVWVYDGTNYYELDSMDNSAGSIPWTTKTWDISALVAGDIFQIIFDAWGANSYNINQWYIDNIALELMPALSQPADVVVSQAGGNVNVDWTDNGAEAYKVFASDDPTTFAGPGTIVNTNAYTTPVGANTKEFYYVTSFFDEGVVVLPTRATRRAPVQGTQPVKEAVETPKRITK